MLSRRRNRRVVLTVLLAALGAAFGAAGAGAVFVEVEFFGGIDVSQFASYKWKEGASAPNFTVERAIRAEVDRQLAAKGLRKVEEEADCYIVTSVVKDLSFPGGALRVEIFEAAAGNLAWSGLATGVVTSKDSKKRQKIAIKAIKKMFKKYPKFGM